MPLAVQIAPTPPSSAARLFEHRRGRVGNPCVNVACAFEIEQRRGVLGILKT
jgi:hypothetical protein